jgi:hypothetical protein
MKNAILWMIMALKDEKRIFYGKKYIKIAAVPGNILESCTS